MDHGEEVPAVIDFAAGAFCEGDGTEAIKPACRGWLLATAHHRVRHTR